MMQRKIVILGLVFVFGIFFNSYQYSLAQEKKFDFNPEVMVKSQTEAKFAPGELILKFKPGQKPRGENPASSGMASIDDASKKNGVYKIEPVFKNHPHDELGQFYKLELSKTADLKKAQAEFGKLDVVEKAAPNFLAKAAWTPPPDDTYYSSQWALAKINASAAWGITQGSSETVIAVIDSGVDTDHPDLASKIWVNTSDPIGGGDNDGNGYIDDNIGWDFVANIGYGIYGPPCIDRLPGDPNLVADNDPNPEPTGLDEDQCRFPGVDNGQHHGTSVAGLAAATTNNAEGIAGVCPNCTIMALRALDDEGEGDFAQIAPAIVYAADKGADVINMSLAGGYGDIDIAAALHYAFNKGSLLVAAAANFDIDIDLIKLSPVCNDDYDYVDGGENEIIGVAATDQNDVRMWWSDYGKKYVDVSAPGTELYAPENGGGYTSGFGGTSGATPIVSGVLGLVKSQHPTWNNKLIRDQTIGLIQNINSQNPSYIGKLGGRVKANRALDATEHLHGSGAVIKGTGNEIYLLQNGQKRHILTVEIFGSYYRSWGYYATISATRIDDYPNGPDLLFKQGTLIRPWGYSTVYQIENPNSFKRHITTTDIYLGLDYDWDDLVGTDISIANLHSSGSDINSLGSHVAGALIKTNSASEVYFLDLLDGIKNKRHIASAEIFNQYFRWQDIAVVEQTELDSYAAGSDYRYQDGTLLKGTSNEIYLISYGKKRHITSAEAYLALGYNWYQYINVDDAELTNYVTGEDIN